MSIFINILIIILGIIFVISMIGGVVLIILEIIDTIHLMENANKKEDE